MNNTKEKKPLAEAFPGGISVSHLRVYDTPAGDGLIGGSPHMHFACSVQGPLRVIKIVQSIIAISFKGFFRL
jgi:hypothetical protein